MFLLLSYHSFHAEMVTEVLLLNSTCGDMQDAKVTAHLVQTPGEADRTVFLIKFSQEASILCRDSKCLSTGVCSFLAAGRCDG